MITGKLVVKGNTTEISFRRARTEDAGVRYPHNGATYPIPAEAITKTGLEFSAAETRAAVALLTRSIRIASKGDKPRENFVEKPGNFFGGHTIARQGFETFQIQGVEFRRLGQGGRLGRHPVQFHLARETPQSTFVKGSSVNESMTRWFTIHGTHGVTLARSVGFRSIGHGFYLEDGTEVDNKLHGNVGIFSRAAIDNAQNPRDGIRADRFSDPGKPQYYLPNAAIGWKQSNGFYYAPAFLSQNLFFGESSARTSSSVIS